MPAGEAFGKGFAFCIFDGPYYDACRNLPSDRSPRTMPHQQHAAHTTAHPDPLGSPTYHSTQRGRGSDDMAYHGVMAQ